MAVPVIEPRSPISQSRVFFFKTISTLKQALWLPSYCILYSPRDLTNTNNVMLYTFLEENMNIKGIFFLFSHIRHTKGHHLKEQGNCFITKVLFNSQCHARLNGCCWVCYSDLMLMLTNYHDWNDCKGSQMKEFGYVSCNNNRKILTLLQVGVWVALCI